MMRRMRTIWLGLALLLAAAPASAQLGAVGGQGAIPQAKDLVSVTASPVSVAAGGKAEAKITLRVKETWHINANPPSLDYMIPTVVKLASAEGVTAGAPVYPPAHKQKLSFEDTPLLVYDREAIVTLPIEAATSATNGTHALHGTVSFQSCNNEVCLAPASVPFELTVTVAAGSGATPAAGTAPAQGAPTDSTAVQGAAPPAGTGFTTAPPPGGAGAAGAAQVDNPIARLFARGSFAAFFGLFVIGLALNLTPCVYPMLGVTVSIFGGRKEARPAQTFGLALLYVLGIAVMYSTLGVVAAFTGGLFGGVLQSPLVLAAIGLLLVGLSLSMFGLYSLQPPPWLLERLGGTGATSAAGIFLSGLVVGVFAAPCVGPPVVALLAVVGAKGDPWFGFKSFFTLAMGLGAPYLVLGTFSNLLRRMPRSGDWMIWVERLFGVILLAVGAFYLLLGFAPSLAFWVLPAALLVGGVYLGFFERSATGRTGFRNLRWAVGVLGIAAGAWLIVTTPKQAVVFAEFNEEALAATLHSGTPAVLDFTANWCAPCHELERITFSDAKVREAMRGFHAYRVDLTHFDSPDVERWRRRYGINGVPTVVFLSPDGSEVRAARVEGFLSPADFLERVKLASAAGARAAGE
jgi:thiol:disulfide interchange protein DsbD